MQANWAACLAFTLAQEGGFENNAADPGTWTGNAVGSGVQIGSNLGISAATLVAFYPNLSTAGLAGLMPVLTTAEAGAIYQQGYWQPIQGASLPSGIDLMLWDDAVNRGVSAAVQTIQGCVGATQDGDLGPLTLAAIQAAPDVCALALTLGAAQAVAYQLGSDWWPFRFGFCNRWSARMAAATTLLGGGN